MAQLESSDRTRIHYQTAGNGTAASFQQVVALAAAILFIGSGLAAFCGDDEYPAVGALDLTDGDIAWSLRSWDEAYRTVIGASEDVVLIEESVSIEESLSVLRAPRVLTWRTMAYDAADGSERWRRATGHTPPPPGPIDGQGIVVLADQEAGALVGLDVLTGVEQWSVASREVPLANSPTVVVVWDMAHPGTPSPFRGMDRLTGNELWVTDILLSDQSGDILPSNQLGSLARPPAAVLDEILVVPTGTTITAIDMRTGAMLWQAPQLGHFAAADGTIIGQRGTGKPGDWTTVSALDAASGRERWKVNQTLPQSGDLVAGDGVIVFMDQINTQTSSEPVLIAYELSSGTKRWHVPLPRDRYLAPQRISGTSLVLLGDREVGVLSTTDGATIWSAKEPFGSPDNIQPQMISVGSNGAAVFVASNSIPAACAPNCD